MFFVKKLLHLFKIRYIQSILLIAIYLAFSSKLSYHHKSIIYSLSSLIKDYISWVAPAAITGYIAFTVKSFGKKAELFIIFLFVFEVLSNFLSTLFGFSWFMFINENIPTKHYLQENNSLDIIFSLPFTKPHWYTCDKSVFVGIILGLIARKSDFLHKYKNFAEFILTKVISSFIPLFVLGYFVNMHYKKTILVLMTSYATLVLYLFLGMQIYIFFIFFLANHRNFKKTIVAIKNILPACLTALTTGCSLSTMPLTILCVSKNVKQKSFARAVIPATTNIQQVGDSIMVAFISIAIYKNFFGTMPSIKICVTSSILMSLARFSTTGVMGGTVFVLLPIVEKSFSFSSEMIAIFVGLNIILNNIVTSGNVMGNCGLCQLMEKIFGKFFNDKNK